MRSISKSLWTFLVTGILFLGSGWTITQAADSASGGGSSTSGESSSGEGSSSSSTGSSEGGGDGGSCCQEEIDVLKTQVGDITRTEMVSALINYWAAQSAQRQLYDQQLMFMVAPGSLYAVSAGLIIAATNNAALGLSMNDTSLIYNLGPLTAATSIVLNGVTYPVNQAQQGPLEFYQMMVPFIQTGDPTNLNMLNPGSMILSDNLVTKNPTLPPEQIIAQAQSLINMITNPYPYIDPQLRAKIKLGTEPLTGPEMEEVADKLSQYAVLGMSVTALSDIIARRVPTTGQTQSVMEVMDQYSQERLANSNWVSQMGAASETALLREIAYMMAFNQWMAYEQFRISEQQLALMASLNAIMAKMNVGLDQMTKQYNLSQAQGKQAQSQLQQQQQQNQSPPPQ